MGGVIQVACCVTHHKDNEEEEEEQAAVVEQKLLFERAESFATTIPPQKTNGHSSP